MDNADVNTHRVQWPDDTHSESCSSERDVYAARCIEFIEQRRKINLLRTFLVIIYWQPLLGVAIACGNCALSFIEW